MNSLICKEYQILQRFNRENMEQSVEFFIKIESRLTAALLCYV